MRVTKSNHFLEACSACNMLELISQAHHLVPIQIYAEAINAGCTLVNLPVCPIIYLCPNCHSYLHLVMNYSFWKKVGFRSQKKAEIFYNEMCTEHKSSIQKLIEQMRTLICQIENEKRRFSS